MASTQSCFGSNLMVRIPASPNRIEELNVVGNPRNEVVPRRLGRAPLSEGRAVVHLYEDAQRRACPCDENRYPAGVCAKIGSRRGRARLTDNRRRLTAGLVEFQHSLNRLHGPSCFDRGSMTAQQHGRECLNCVGEFWVAPP